MFLIFFKEIIDLIIMVWVLSFFFLLLLIKVFSSKRYWSLFLKMISDVIYMGLKKRKKGKKRNVFQVCF